MLAPADPITPYHIEVLPPEIIFSDIRPNQTYEMTVYVKNLTSSAKRLRIFQPSSLFFRCDYDLSKSLAPGLALKLLISFETSKSGEFHDSLYVVSDKDFRKEVKLHAYPLRSQITFEPFVNLGFVRLQTEKTAIISFKNEGKSLGKVELKFDKLQNTTLDPNFFTMQPGQEVRIKMTYHPRVAGILKGKIEVIVDGQTFQNFLEVNAIAVEYNRFFIDIKGQIISKMDFGSCYYGQEKETTLFLVNNTPKATRFQAKLKSNKHSGVAGIERFITPHETGIEELERVLICKPNIGVLEPYSQIKLQIICRPQITEKTHIWTQHYSMMKEDLEAIPEKFSYLGVCEFEDLNEEDFPNLLIIAQALCPQVKISSLVLNYGECAMNDRRDLELFLENKNPMIPIDFDHEAVSSFKMTPSPSEIPAKGEIRCLASFLPKSLGTFQLEFSLYLLNGQYKIPMKLFGKSSTIIQKEIIARGVETIPKDFETSPKLIETDKFEVHYHKKKKRENLLYSFSMVDLKENAKSILQMNPLLDDELLFKELNKRKYDKYIKDKRKNRIKSEKDKKFEDQKNNIENRFKEIEMMGSGTVKNEDIDEEIGYKKANPPVDYDFLYSLNLRTSETPKLLPLKNKDPLFVLKPILNYEPLQILETQAFNPNSKASPKRPFQSKPRTHTETRDCALSLEPDQLKRVFAGPKIIDFGVLYVKSIGRRCFSIRNDLKTCISARIIPEQEELKTSYQEMQIIPSTETGQFEIFLTSSLLHEFKGTIKYIINEKYTFELQVKGIIDYVKLENEPKNLRFFFGEESEDMEVIEKVRLFNPGNDFAHYECLLNENKIFTVEPRQGKVPAYQSQDIQVIYRPSGNCFNRPEEEKVIIKVKDGFDISFKCSGIAPDSKCTVKEPSKIDFGELQVSQSKEGFLSVRNNLRHSTAFQIIKDYPNSLEIFPMKGKILGEETKSMKFYFFSNEEIVLKEIMIKIMFKGGKSIKIPFSVRTIIPLVELLEEIYDFGVVTTLGNSGLLKLTLRNLSNIKANLILDLREEGKELKGLDCLDFEVIELEGSRKGDSTVIVNIDQNEENEHNFEKSQRELLKIKEDINIDEQSDSSSDNTDFEDLPQNKYQRISINPQQSFQFQLKFSPKEVKNYMFQVPLSLEGHSKPTEGLLRWVRCEGSKPKLLIDPQIIDFKKKIINTDKFQPKKQEITIMNTDESPLSFFFDTSDLETDKVFSIIPSEGILAPGETIVLETGFNPFTHMNYERKAGLFVNGEKEKAYLDVSFKGNGAYPRLIFDRREIIMPIVPLGVISRCMFKIVNDGFENLAINHNLPKDIGFHLDLEYLEGKNIGVTKNKLKIEAQFSSKQPISFTTKLEFLDSDGRSYLIPISGTTDNCLFTNFPYFQRTPFKEYQILSPNDSPILLQEAQNELDSSIIVQDKKKALSSVISSKTSYKKNIFGCSLIPNTLLTSSLENIQRWMNHFVLSTPLQCFPDDVISSNGAQFFDLFHYLTGRPFTNKGKFDIPLKKTERINLLIKQYNDFLLFIMSQGCLLGTIRPYYLLNYADFSFYLRTNQVEYLSNASFRPNPAQFAYISADAWITLFYQLIKVYYLSRISVKSFRKQFSNEKLPNFYLEDSNLYSVNEALILRWIELYQKDPKLRITNLDRDLRNSHYISSIIQGYINTPSIRSILNLKPECENPDDLLYNAEKVLQALSFIGLETHYQAKSLASPSARENLLFLIHIYESLLHYIPKEDPIIFSCILGEEVIKDIELKNPTKKTITFWVKYEGNKDFTINEDTVKIEPLGKVFYRVKFISRIFEQVTGRITFFNKRESNINAAAIVFDLKSDIIERKSVEVLKISTLMYQTKQEFLSIKNPFMNSPIEYADFQLSLIIEKLPKEVPQVKSPKKTAKRLIKEKNKGNKGNKTNKTNSSLESSKNSPKNSLTKGHIISNIKGNNSEILSFLMPTFILSKEKLRLKRGESIQISIFYLPMIYEDYKCKIICCDKEVGEFQLEIHAETLLPEVLYDIKPGNSTNPLYVETGITYECNIAFRNENLNNAKKFHEGRLANTAKYKENLLKFKQVTKSPEEIHFKTELVPPSPYITLPETFIIKDPLTQTSLPSISSPLGGKRSVLEEDIPELGSMTLLNSANEVNHLPIDLLFKFPVSNESHNLILRSEDNSDIRVYRLVLTINPKITKGVIKLKCPFGDVLKQDIPFYNPSERDWLIRSFINEDLNKYPIPTVFSCPKEFVVKRKSHWNSSISFNPVHSKDIYEGKLTIINTVTNDHFEYELIGQAEEPLAKRHIAIKCIAQKPLQKSIELQNPYSNRILTYIIETDLINTNGPNKISIDPFKTQLYTFTVNPLIGGVYTGSITFIEEHEREKFIWFTVCIETERSKPKSMIDLHSEIRKKSLCNIELFNPLDENIEFEVILEGEGLNGNPFLSIPRKNSVVYELEFLPLRVFHLNGSISFIHEKIGEIWYELSLISKEIKQEKLPLIKAELGKSIDLAILLENPSLKPAIVKALVTNPSNFSLKTDNIIIPPLKEATIQITYSPSKLEEVELGELFFESDNIGNWGFNVSGIGTPPKDFPLKKVECPVDRELTQVINFKNPLNEDIIVQIILKQEGNGFKLLGYKGTVTIQGQTNYQIPFIFTPKGIKEYYCEIIIEWNEKVKWVFPIKGLGEYIMNENIYSYKCKSREIFNGDLKLTVPGIVESFLKKAFRLEIENIPEEYISAVNRSLKIVSIKNMVNSLEDHLRFKIIFSPMKPFKVLLDMLLTTATGGRWKFKLNLESTEPEQDDIIQIYSPLHKTTSVSFKLSNRYKAIADFKAYFTYDSDPEFSVIPKQGVLEAYGKEGSIFIVSFTPVEYGKNKYGKLIIETNEIYWSYIIRGTFPQYHPPESHSMISNRFDSGVLERMKGNSIIQKNHLIENIKKSKWNSDEKKRFYNELGLEKSTEISSIARIIDNSKDISLILGQRDLFSGKYTEKNDQSTKNTVDQSISFKKALNNPVYKSYQG